MATGTLFTNAQIDQVTLGNGTLLIGTPFKDAGPIKGNAQLDITRKVLPFKAGIPQILYKQVVTDEDVFFKATLASLNLSIVEEALGIGQFTPIAGGSTPASATLQFNDPDGNNQPVGLNLGAHDITTPAPVVKSGDGLTTYIVNTDYVIDSVNGLIYRVTGGSIPATGTIQVQFTYTAIAAEVYQFGGLSRINYMPGQFIHPREDGMRLIADMYRMSTNGRLLLEWREVEWDLFDVQWNLIADLGRQFGNLYFQLRREYGTTAG